MLWAFWEDYYNYEQIDKEDIGNQVYNGRLNNSGTDGLLVFNILAAQDWSTLSGTETPRDVHSIQDLGYKYMADNFIVDANFQDADLNDNWFMPSSSRRRMAARSDSSFEKVIYNRLVQKYGGSLSSDAYEERRQIMKSLSTMSCEYVNIGDNDCRRPNHFDDFSDIPLGPNMYNNRNDLNKTLDELIDAVSDYPCMVEARQLMFGWVSQLGGIWRLARGDFDRFCDKKFLRMENGDGNTVDQCRARGFIIRRP